MWRPRLNENHVGSNKASGVGTAPCVWPTIEHDRPVTIVGITKNLVEMNGEPIQMSNVEGTEICMESVVKQGIIYCEVDRTTLSRRA